MAISEIQSQGALPLSAKDKKAKEPPRPLPPGKDKVELSSEAKSLFEADQQQRLAEIRERIRTNYYMSDEVTRRVVDAILRDLTK